MKKTIIKLGLIFSILISLQSCDDFLGDNINPNKINVDQVTVQELLPTTIYYTSSAQYSASSGMCQYSQQLASYFEKSTDAFGETSVGGFWTNVYLQAIPNLVVLTQKAEANGDEAYLAIGKILIAFNLGTAVDLYDAIPVDDVLTGEQVLAPTFQSGEYAYGVVNKMLDEAISLLSAPGGTTPGADDLIYGGDLTKWRKAAYALKARYALHLSKIDKTTAATNALTYLANAMTSNSDDFQLNYNSRNFNPWHAGVALANNTGNLSLLPNAQLTSMMNGDFYPFIKISMDPRLAKIMLVEKDKPYLGGLSGEAGISKYTATDTLSSTVDFGVEDFYSSQASPIVFMSYAEQKFIEAEAEFIKNGGTTTSIGSNAAAYNAYLDGIAANMDKVGVTASDKANYLAETSVSFGFTKLKLEHIMHEKFIATYLNMESFNDQRRYDFSSDVFKGLSKPLHPTETTFTGQWPRRAVYPDSERTRNAANVDPVYKNGDAKIWWDK